MLICTVLNSLSFQIMHQNIAISCVTAKSVLYYWSQNSTGMVVMNNKTLKVVTVDENEINSDRV